jgi:phosphoribosyl-AMP cyclohydrolase
MSEIEKLSQADFIQNLIYDQNGLVPAIIQDVNDGAVLMLGYMNLESLKQTMEKGKVTFWSRSRQVYWTKGETSGNYLHVVEIYADCDRDALLIKAVPHGPTCHTEKRSCFSWQLGE